MKEAYNSPISVDEKFCRTCRFYQFYSDREQDVSGSCVRYAPSPLLVETENEEDLFSINKSSTLHYAKWPTVRFNAWCGDWQHFCS